MIEIDLGGSKRVRVDANVDTDALGRVLDVLGRKMISIPSGVRVWLVTGHTDMRSGFPRLSLLVQET